MAKDYAKKNSKTKSASRTANVSKKRSSPHSNPHSSNWMLAGFIVVIIIGSLLFVKAHHIETIKHTMLAALHPKPQEQPKVNKQTEPEYDFYTILPKQKVWVPDNSTLTPATTPSPSPSTSTVLPAIAPPFTATTKPQPQPKTPSLYMVQIGAFEKYDAADNLRAKLIMEGYVVHVDVKPVKGLTRVWLGPFKNLSEARAMQTKISKTDQLKGIIASLS